MPTVNCGSCGIKLDVPEKKIGSAVKCPACKGDMFIQIALPQEVLDQAEDQSEQPATSLARIQEPTRPAPSHPREYKVLRFDGAFLTASMDTSKMEGVLNEHAQEGWTVKGVVEFDPPSLTGDARAIVVIMER